MWHQHLNIVFLPKSCIWTVRAAQMRRESLRLLWFFTIAKNPIYKYDHILVHFLYRHIPCNVSLQRARSWNILNNLRISEPMRCFLAKMTHHSISTQSEIHQHIRGRYHHCSSTQINHTTRNAFIFQWNFIENLRLHNDSFECSRCTILCTRPLELFTCFTQFNGNFELNPPNIAVKGLYSLLCILQRMTLAAIDVMPPSHLAVEIYCFLIFAHFRIVLPYRFNRRFENK